MFSLQQGVLKWLEKAVNYIESDSSTNKDRDPTGKIKV